MRVRSLDLTPSKTARTMSDAILLAVSHSRH